MNKIQILEDHGLLGNIRQRLGASDENDTTLDYKIEKMDARALIAVYYGWELGDDNWGYIIINDYENLKEELEDVA